MAAEQGEKLDGKVVEILGHYEPAAESKPFVFDKEKVQGWLSKGALPSNTVAKLLNGQGFELPVHLHAEAKPKKKAQAKLEVANKPVEVAPAPEQAEVPSEEAPEEEVAVEEASVVAEVPVEESAPAEEAPAEDTETSEK